jgi:gliding motility-associated lipoprotein GldJ
MILIIIEEISFKNEMISEDGKTTKTAKIIDSVKYKILANGKRVATNLPGEVSKINLSEEDTRFRTNYSQSYNINFRDGDRKSSRRFDNNELDDGELEEDEEKKMEKETKSMYNSPDLRKVDENGNFIYDDSDKRTSLINDKSRVYKGGSWKDRAYWLDPAQRRFYPEEMSTDYIGFRCAMSRVGAKNEGGKKSRN